MQYKMLTKDKEVKKFFNCVDQKPLSAMYHLGNLFALENNGYKRAKGVLTAINAKITSKQLAAILKTALNMPKTKKIILEQGNTESIEALKHGVLQTKGWYELLASKQIIQMGQDLEFTREALIALVAKHKDNAEVFEDFEYEILMSAGSKQNSKYVSEFVAECGALPVVDIKALCKEREDVAKVVMLDIEGHSDRFNIDSYIVRQHPRLRKNILKNWEETKSSLPLDDEEVKEIQKFAKSLSKQFPEFAKVLEAERIERDQPNKETREAQQRRSPEMGPLGFLGYAVTYKYAMGLATKYVFSKPLVAGALSFLPASVPSALVTGAILTARDVYYANQEAAKNIKLRP